MVRCELAIVIELLSIEATHIEVRVPFGKEMCVQLSIP